MRILHIVPGLGDQCNGIAVAAKLMASEQNADLMEARSFCDGKWNLSRYDEVCVHSAWLPMVYRSCHRVLSSGKRLVRMPHANHDPIRLAYHGWKKSLVAPIERYFLRKSDKVVATCQAESGWIRAYEPRVKSIELIDLKHFFNLANPSEPPKPSEHSELHILYLGRRHPLKGLEYLEASVSQLHLSTSTRLNKIELKVVSNAFGEEKERVWNWCDVLVLPTLSDNFGLVVAEALERGKRVITTDGAPAWGSGNTYDGRLTYLRAYRDGTPDERVRLLKKALEGLCK